MSRALVVALLLWPSPAAARCPEKGETQADCPWAGIARGLAGAADVKAELRRRAPGVVRQLEHDAADAPLLALWGRSLNHDERAGGTIVEPAIVDALLALGSGPPRDGRVVHAGIEHTYGYLFSLLPTPFGWKRARWVGGELEAGFGLPSGLLGPSPSQGTLLANVTVLAGRIAGIPVDGVAAAPAIRRLELRRRFRIEESAPGVVLRTDVVAFPKPGAKNSHLLVYSVADASGAARLITAFPIDDAFVERLADPAELGDDRPIAARYNAHVEGLGGARGRRAIVK